MVLVNSIARHAQSSVRSIYLRSLAFTTVKAAHSSCWLLTDITGLGITSGIVFQTECGIPGVALLLAFC